ncbi:MAG: chalcone isomerase family protein [bacterium]
MSASPNSAASLRLRRTGVRLRAKNVSLRARGVPIGLLLLLAIGSLGPLHPGIARAAEIEDISFPAQVQAGPHRLAVFGLGLLRYRVLFRGYVGALYLPPGASADDVLEDIPKALELHYFWDIEGRFFGEKADELLEETLAPQRLESLRERLDRLHSLYRDVEAGDRYRLTYLPGRGTTLTYNGEALGTIPGADFARAYFGIWLGPEPLNESFRDQILGRR